jgi:hypothetical protein
MVNEMARSPELTRERLSQSVLKLLSEAGTGGFLMKPLPQENIGFWKKKPIFIPCILQI